MNYHAFFSPTGGTKKVTETMAESFAGSNAIDLSSEISDYFMTKDDFCIVGAPSFGGRVPATVTERLGRLHGNQTPVLSVVTYGNRAYEDTLRELKDVLARQGFVPIGAAAIITQHSIIPEYGAGRPNQEDLAKICAFMQTIKARLSSEYPTVEVPGNIPYKELRVAQMQPRTSEDCVMCGLCAKLCPIHAISFKNPRETDFERCISCMRCVHICPNHARQSNAETIQMLTEKLRPICSVYKEIELY